MMKNQPELRCPYSGSRNVEVVYEGPIRSGGASSGVEEGFKILTCPDNHLVWLIPFPERLDEYYAGKAYWAEHHDQKVEVSHLRSKLDHEQVIWLNKIGFESFRGKKVIDFGCGAGIFFDFIKGISTERLGVDLTDAFKSHLISEGHEFVLYPALKNEPWADIAVSFDTLEHVPEPWRFLETVFANLKPGGKFYLGVPNFHDFLKLLTPAYLPFFYHKSHLWYFSDSALIPLLERAGFMVETTQSVHKYDLNNMVNWLGNGKGVGKKGSSVFDQPSDDAFISHVERQGIGSHILITAKKPEMHG